MSTRFFLVDERYMSETEIADAKRFDESASICQRQGCPTGAVFTLEIPNISFYNLPRDARVTNDNNDLVLETVGDLIDATKETTNRVITRYEAEQNAEVELARLRDERKWQKEWRGILPEQLPPSRSRVAEYAKRVSQRAL